jgi:ArsR family transcriptional regulator
MTNALNRQALNDIRPFLKALASESRQEILLLFADGRPRSVNEIAGVTGLAQPTASLHLAALKRAGILTSQREGKEVCYRPDRERILQLMREFTALLTRCCR